MLLQSKYLQHLKDWIVRIKSFVFVWQRINCSIVNIWNASFEKFEWCSKRENFCIIQTCAISQYLTLIGWDRFLKRYSYRYREILVGKDILLWSDEISFWRDTDTDTGKFWLVIGKKLLWTCTAWMRRKNEQSDPCKTFPCTLSLPLDWELFESDQVDNLLLPNWVLSDQNLCVSIWS